MSGVFGVVRRASPYASKNVPVRSAFSVKVPIPVITARQDPAIMEKLGLLMMLTGTSQSTSLDEWNVYIAAYSIFMFPALLPHIMKGSYRPVQVSEEDIAGLVALVDAFHKLPEDATEAQIQQARAGLDHLVVLNGFPALATGLKWEESIIEARPRVVASHYAITLFLCGRLDHAAITQTHPDTLIRKMHLVSPITVLNGECRLSDMSHSRINDAWAESGTLRFACITAFAQFSQMGTDIYQDAVYTTMRLLRFSGMQHVRIIYALVKAYPWVTDVPALRPSLAVYVDSVFALCKNKDLMPYVKLIYGDKIEVFPRKELEPLVACAVTVTREVTDSLQAFYGSGRYQTFVDSFTEERIRRQNIGIPPR